MDNAVFLHDILRVEDVRLSEAVAELCAELVKRGIPENQIRKFGIGYKGKEVLVKKG